MVSCQGGPQAMRYGKALRRTRHVSSQVPICVGRVHGVQLLLAVQHRLSWTQKGGIEPGKMVFELGKMVI